MNITEAVSLPTPNIQHAVSDHDASSSVWFEMIIVYGVVAAFLTLCWCN